MNVVIVLMRQVSYPGINGTLLYQAIKGHPSRISLTGRLLWRLFVEKRNDDLLAFVRFDRFGRPGGAGFPYTFHRQHVHHHMDGFAVGCLSSSLAP